MKAKLILPILVMLAAACSQPKKEPINHRKQLADQLVMATVWFQQSAEMDASYLQAFEWGKFLLDRKLDTLKAGIKTGVVLDIDETVLDNSPYEAWLINKAEQYASKSWKEWTDQARARALPGALDFVKYAKSRSVEVFYISNRRLNELPATLKNLDSLGFVNADSAHVLLMDKSSNKTERRALVNEKVKVILYVGDNLTDYSEAYADRGGDLGKDVVHRTKAEWIYNFVMLPNPTYGEWEKAVYGNDFSIPDSVKVQKRLKILED